MSYPKAGSLSGEDSKTLEHLRFDKAKNRILSDRALEVTVNTLGFGESHDVYAAGENVGFTNNNSDIAFSPVWQGIRDQSIPANQGESGVIAASSRGYSPLADIEPNGAPHQTEIISYSTTTTATSNEAIFHSGVILGEDVAADDWISFEVYFGNSETGKIAFRSQSTGSAHLVGDSYAKWFGDNGEKGTRRLEFFQGQQVTIVVSISKGGEDGEKSALLVRAAAENPSLPYSTFKVRVFTDIATPKNEFAEIKYFGLRSSDFGDWLLCNGSAISEADQAKIAANAPSGMQTLWNSTYGTNTRPSMTGRVAASVTSGHSMGSVTGWETQALTTANLPVHNHSTTVTGSSGSYHTHSATTSSGGEHSHSGQASSTYATSGSNYHVPVTVGSWSFTTGSTSSGGNKFTYNGNYTNTDDNLYHNHSLSINAASSHTHSLSTGNASSSHTHTISQSNVGGNTAHNNMQPTSYAGNYFIYIGA